MKAFQNLDLDGLNVVLPTALDATVAVTMKGASHLMWFIIMIMVLVGMDVAAAEPPIHNARISLPHGDRAALDAAVSDLCGRQIVMLGEAPTHGDGHTAAFKAALVRQLVSRCHFGAVAFESSRYEFIAFDRAVRRGEATPMQLADAIGGLWKFDKEIQPLIAFLFAEADAGQMYLAGLDSQLGGLGQGFTNERMVPELTDRLSADEARKCNAAFAERIAWSYPQDRPYGRTQHEQLLTCAAKMRAALLADMRTGDVTRAEQEAMIGNIEWAIGPDLGAEDEQLAARERTLYRNLLQFAQTLPPKSKIIVWGATKHLAKEAIAIPRPRADRTMGAMVHEHYSGNVFTLGFSAESGSYRVFRKSVAIEPPPASSIEARAAIGTHASALYLDKRQLSEMGLVESGALDHAYRRANWADVVDAMVVFREEWPSHSTRPDY